MKRTTPLILALVGLALGSHAWAMTGGKAKFSEKNKQGQVEVFTMGGGSFRYFKEDGFPRAWTGDGASRRAGFAFLYSPPAKTALVLGPGACAAVDVALLHGAERVDAVMKNPAAPKAVEAYSERHGAALKDKRTRIINADPSGWAPGGKAEYDTAVLWPAVYKPEEMAGVITTETLGGIKALLNPGGTATLNIPLGLYKPSDLKRILATFAAVFPNMAIWVPELDPELGWALLTGSSSPIKIDMALARKRLRELSAAGKITEGDDVASFLSFHITDGAGLAKALKGIKPIRKADKDVWRPKLPASKEGEKLSLENFKFLVSLRTPVTALTDATGEDARRLDAYFNGRTGILEGRVARAVGQWQKEIGYYEKAEKSAPTDPYLAAQYVSIGQSYLRTEMPDRAATAFMTATRLAPNSAPAHYYLGKAYEAMTRWEKAGPELNRAKELDPDFVELVEDVDMGQ